MKRSPRIIALVLVILLLLICDLGCSKKNKQTPIRIALNIWPGYGAFFIAEDKGFFEQENVSVDVQIIQGDAEREAALISGNIDGIGMTLDNLVVLRDKDIDVKAIFKYDDSYGADGIVAIKSIASVGDLKGKRISWAPATTSHYFLTQVLKEANLNTKDLDHVAMSSDDGGAAFAAGKLDAAVTWEPWLSKAQQMENGHLLISTKDKPVVDDVLFMRTNTLEKRRDAIKRFLKACFNAIDYWKEHPTEGNKIIAKNLKLPVKDVEDMLSGIRIMDYEDNVKFFGSADNPGPIYEAFDRCVNAWKQEGIIEASPSSSQSIDASFIQSLNMN